MKSLVFLFTLLIGGANAQASLLCIDTDAITGKLCLRKQIKDPKPKQLEFITQMQNKIEFHIGKNCLAKDGSCITRAWIEYCDTQIRVCNMYGEIDEEDTGTFYVYRVTYSYNKNGFLVLDNVTKTSEFGYPN